MSFSNINWQDRRIYAQVRINNQGPVRFEVDTGADLTLIPPSTAQQLGISSRSSQAGPALHISGVGGGGGGTPTFIVNMQIENTPAFQTVVAIMDTPAPLLCSRDITKRYNLDVSASGAQLIPIAGKQSPSRILVAEAAPLALPQVHPKVQAIANLAYSDNFGVGTSYDFGNEKGILEEGDIDDPINPNQLRDVDIDFSEAINIKGTFGLEELLMITGASLFIMFVLAKEKKG